MKLFLFFLFLLLSFQNEVLICKSGAAYAYHSHYCQGLKECKHAVEKVTVQEARVQGRKACGYCYKIEGEKESPAEQCLANTKSGKRCSRKAGPNGYCWQHTKA